MKERTHGLQLTYLSTQSTAPTPVTGAAPKPSPGLEPAASGAAIASAASGAPFTNPDGDAGTQAAAC